LQEGSILALPESLNKAHEGEGYVVEGIGYDFIPQVLSRDPKDIDAWVKTSDAEAFSAVQAIMRNEGLLVGGSSGSSLSGALKWLSETEEGRKVAQKEDANVIVILPDGCVSFNVPTLSSSHVFSQDQELYWQRVVPELFFEG
jgi:cystathionine beta-synthase